MTKLRWPESGLRMNDTSSQIRPSRQVCRALFRRRFHAMHSERRFGYMSNRSTRRSWLPTNCQLAWTEMEFDHDDPTVKLARECGIRFYSMLLHQARVWNPTADIDAWHFRSGATVSRKWYGNTFIASVEWKDGRRRTFVSKGAWPWQKCLVRAWKCAAGKLNAA